MVIDPSAALTILTHDDPCGISDGRGMKPEHGVSVLGPGVSSPRYGPRVSTQGIVITFRDFDVRPTTAFFFVGLLLGTVGSCNGPVKPDGDTRFVNALDLVGKYRTDPDTAHIVFTKEFVRVHVTAAVVVGNEVHWKLQFGGDPPYPPAIVFVFDSKPPPLSFPCNIEGLCTGRRDDGKDRGPPGYGFEVRVSGCRVVPGP
jgi:hypothetical protein